MELGEPRISETFINEKITPNFPSNTQNRGLKEVINMKLTQNPGECNDMHKLQGKWMVK